MKIAIISTVLPHYGGMGRVLDCEAKEFYKKGIDFTVFVPDYGEKVEKEYKIEYLKPFIKIGYGSICLDLLKKIKDFDIIYIHYPAFGLAEQVLFLNKGSKKIFIRYHMDLADGGIKGFIFKISKYFIMPFILKKADKIFFSTLDYGEYSDAKKFINKGEEIAFGVDNNKFYFDENKQKENKILFVSKLDKHHYFKGLENLIVAFSNIIKRDKFKDLKLNVVGRGELLDYYKDIAKSNMVEKNINFLDNCPDELLRNEYQTSIATILPSINKNEAFGLVLIESLACGTPIIASNLPGVRTIVNDKRFISEVNDIKSVEEAINNMLNLYFNNKEEYCLLQKKYLEDVEKKYNWKNILNII